MAATTDGITFTIDAAREMFAHLTRVIDDIAPYGGDFAKQTALLAGIRLAFNAKLAAHDIRNLSAGAIDAH